MIENYGNAIFLKNAYLLLIVFDVNDIFISQDIVYSSFVFLFVFPWHPRYFIFFFLMKILRLPGCICVLVCADIQVKEKSS